MSTSSDDTFETISAPDHSSKYTYITAASPSVFFGFAPLKRVTHFLEPEDIETNYEADDESEGLN